MFDQENGVDGLTFGQFNVYVAQTDNTIQMLNDIWSNLVNKVEAAKKRHEELEGATMITNDRLNNGISALDARLDRLEDGFRTIHNMQDNVRTTVNKQQCQIYDMDSRISFYSGSLVQLEGKKAEEVKARFDALEQRVAGQCHNLILGKPSSTFFAKILVTSKPINMFQFDEPIINTVTWLALHQARTNTHPWTNV